jgi:hypothetical protein
LLNYIFLSAKKQEKSLTLPSIGWCKKIVLRKANGCRRKPYRVFSLERYLGMITSDIYYLLGGF